jgi:hypothetical protein
MAILQPRRTIIGAESGWYRHQERNSGLSYGGAPLRRQGLPRAGGVFAQRLDGCEAAVPCPVWTKKTRGYRPPAPRVESLKSRGSLSLSY